MNENDITINPGDLRHHLTLLEPTTGTDASGVVTTFAAGDPALKVWSKIEGLGAEDAIKSGQDISRVQLKITMRYNAAVLPTKQLQRWNGNRYIIKGIVDVQERGVKLIVYCEGIGLNV